METGKLTLNFAAISLLTAGETQAQALNTSSISAVTFYENDSATAYLYDNYYDLEHFRPSRCLQRRGHLRS